ncbi:sulfotransferase family protein [uncultured Microbulbifer sp.]|uniref:sulfotransferase family protein n=1 Tax=uncultured Microbulbifer sp. TaxID=348147 RepID=UPI0025EB5B40|nr:sulfotransferase family protein [uncultured Microbulbifer sp.]
MNSPIIGASLGRTGTYSLKLALERLGFAPCLHMSDFSSNPALCRKWIRALDSGFPDWPALLNGYRAVVDWPACNHVAEFLQCFPNATVIYTERTFEDWYSSIRQTIVPALQWSTQIASGKRSPFIELANHEVLGTSFQGKLDRDSLKLVYEQHRQQIAELVPSEQILFIDLQQGWVPLCQFLGFPVPEDTFPHANMAGDFVRTLRRNRRA